ncbi:MAG: CinA family protein [Caldilineae bacterium]|nr:CinA family protein [Anaerolineae bacterium]MCB9154798.1 CinA family protein [Caldilineae bacterium]
MEPYNLAQRAGHLLLERGLTLAVAESCTGGLVGDMITDVPGSSAYFLGGIQSYADAAKRDVLGVRAETLAQHGAVSAACAQEMARGARRLIGADVALSVTGIAGPGGGSAEKPTGLTFIHLAAADTDLGHRFVWSGDRRANKLSSAAAALQLLIDYLENE